MQVYLVGGAVRDGLMKRHVVERDWVVVGSTPEQMLALGYQQVGKEFPVYLHPETKEEYALARKERKVSAGYKGFVCDFGPEVTLDEDLIRRDLTINAIAESADGELHDPHRGVEDINQRLLRHISPAFSEDPVRVLRVARFAARFGDFEVADETLTLMRLMADQGEIDALTPERVWKEFEKALSEANPERFLEVLHCSDALAIIFPALDSNYEAAQHYLSQAASNTKNIMSRLAILFSLTSIDDIQTMVERYRIPNQFSEIALMVKRELPKFTKLDVDDKKHLLDLYYQLDAFRRPERFEHCLSVIKLLIKIKDNIDRSADFEQAISMLNELLQVKVDLSRVPELKGKAIAEYIYQQRLLSM